MIDLKLLREEPGRWSRASQRARGEDPGLVDALLEADAARRSAVSAADNLRAEQKAVEQAGRARRRPDERPALLARAKELAEQVKAAEAEQARRRSRPSPRRTWRSRTSSSTVSRPAARTTSPCSRPSASRRPSTPEGPPRTRRVAGADRHGARREGVGLAVLLPHRRTARCCSSA